MLSWATGHWSVPPVLAGLVTVTALVHQVGYLRLRRADRAWRSEQVAPHWVWRALAFYLALAVLYLAFASPLGYWSRQLFWAHMIQQLLLVSAAGPGIALGAPWVPIARGLPDAVGRALQRTAGLFSSAGRLLTRPVVALVCFNAVFLASAVPSAYQLTLRSPLARGVRDVLLVGLAVDLWAQIVDSPPFRSALNYVQRCVFIFFNAAIEWVLAIALGYANQPMYAAIPGHGARPGRLSAYADQQLAAGVLWVPGSVIYTLAFIWCLWRWLEAEEDADAGLRRLVDDVMRPNRSHPARGSG